MLRKILIVDDSALIHQMCALFLADYRETGLVSAMDGAAALEVLSRDTEIDLVLLDINMPVMNGLEMLAHLQSEATYRSIPVIMITTHGGEQDAARCLGMGARGFLTKPFRTSQLHTLIHEITGEKPVGHEPQSV